MSLSTHKVEVIPIKLEKHPNADSLSIVRVFGYTVCVRTDDWKDGELGAYIVPDTLVDIRRPEFAFLATAGSIYNEYYHRVKVKKLRQIISQGLLVKAPPGSKEGEDVSEYFGTIRYEAQEKTSRGEDFETGPDFGSKYDLDSFYRYSRLFSPGEKVVVTEKIDGSNVKYMYDGRMWVGSRSGWRKESEESIYWKALKKTPSIQELCAYHPGLILYGEVYGDNGKMRYGLSPKNVSFAAFDIFHENQWMSPSDRINMLLSFSIPTVPVLAHAWPFDHDKVKEFAEGLTTINAAHIREGCVVEPIEPRYDDHIGRVKLKIVGNGYMEKA